MMKYRIQIDTSVWSLLGESIDIDEKKNKEKKAIEKLLKIYEIEKLFEIFISQPVLEELQRSSKNRRAMEFINRNSITKLEYDIFCGFILGSPKHGVLGKSMLGTHPHPDKIKIDSVEKLQNEKNSTDRYILEHNINNEIHLLITFNSRDFFKPEIRDKVSLPSEFLQILKSNSQ